MSALKTWSSRISSSHWQQQFFEEDGSFNRRETSTALKKGHVRVAGPTYLKPANNKYTIFEKGLIIWIALIDCAVQILVQQELKEHFLFLSHRP